MKAVAWAILAGAILTVVVWVVVVFEQEAWRTAFDDSRAGPVRIAMGAWAAVVLGLIGVLAHKLRPRP